LEPSTTGRGDGSFFEFKGNASTDRFVIKLVEADKIAHARKVLRCEEKLRVHVQGTIVQQKASYNPHWCPWASKLTREIPASDSKKPIGGEL
jgi:hypothetical protein